MTQVTSNEWCKALTNFANQERKLKITQAIEPITISLGATFGGITTVAIGASIGLGFLPCIAIGAAGVAGGGYLGWSHNQSEQQDQVGSMKNMLTKMRAVERPTGTPVAPSNPKMRSCTDIKTRSCFGSWG